MTAKNKAERMTAADARELATVVRMRARVAREDAELRGAQLIADFEEELAAEYPANDPRWAELTAEAEEAVRRADAELAARCKKLGIRPEFRPNLSVSWYSSGENAYHDRRATLRAAAKARVAAMVKQAKLSIARSETEARSTIAERMLTTNEAKGLLEAIPTVEVLLPTLALRAVEAETPNRPLRW